MIADAGQHIGEPGAGIDVVELGSLKQGVHDRGALAATFGASEQPGFPPKSHCPFILPMSGTSWKSTTDGIRISAAKSPFAEWSSGQPASFLGSWGQPAS